MKVVLDTNVLVSGLAYPQSTPGLVVSAWREGRFDLVISQHQLEELARVLAYPRIAQRLGWSDGQVSAFLKQLLLRAELIDVQGTRTNEVRDPADQPILASLVAGAECLVSGDRDLLVLGDQYRILSPAEFAKTL